MLHCAYHQKRVAKFKATAENSAPRTDQWKCNHTKLSDREVTWDTRERERKKRRKWQKSGLLYRYRQAVFTHLKGKILKVWLFGFLHFVSTCKWANWTNRSQVIRTNACMSIVELLLEGLIRSFHKRLWFSLLLGSIHKLCKAKIGLLNPSSSPSVG